MEMIVRVLLIALALAAANACNKPEPEEQPAPEPTVLAPAPEPHDAATLIARAKALFPPPPEVAENAKNPLTEAKIALGRQLYFEKRLSLGQDLSCNSCHDLASYGVDVREDDRRTSAGHRAQRGDRNTPTVYNAALHFVQFWDGRAADVEEQAKGPILNPVEMAMAGDAAVVAMLRSIPGYEALFKAAFPDEADPFSYDNVGKAIGAFERRLITRSPVDDFLAGNADALSENQRKGFALFLDAGCIACHTGAAWGGGMYQKIGLLKPYPTADEGRFVVTKSEADKFLFKVPSLRNIAKTAPYFHDGSVATLEQAVRIMAEHQTPKGTLSDEEAHLLVTFLEALTGPLPAEYIAEPPALPGGPKTPRPAS
jgi:cytochrome c peroxidase